MSGIERPYIAGSQMWFSGKGKFGRDARICGFGCGVVALLDFCVYEQALPAAESREEYLDRIRQMERRALPIVPGFGIAPYLYPILVNLFFRRNRIPYRMRGMVGAGNREALEEMLKNDIPVIFAAGPTVPVLWRKKRLPLYPAKGTMSEKSIKAHYMTLLGLEGEGEHTWMRVASWGEIYRIRLSDYRRFTRYTIPFTNRFYRMERVGGAEERSAGEAGAIRRKDQLH
ncbi:MAG: hypothetical protein K6E92_03650 [Lachnospiraceae bacterium]|nr:hypothetical protein [Lachnospiraceae bacterium]